MNPKVILGLLMSASVGALLPIGNSSATAAAFSERSESARQSVIQVDVVDLAERDSSEQLIAGNSSSNSSSDSSSNSNSNSSSDSSSNNNSNSSSDSSSNSNSNSSR
ncbi:MAG: hypothetical protein HC769_02040 [Cyanobacteria bacterium CRU_2_1]|nr:hypothetical protein [Cyanobacteria bacterium RU_5_0]NJR57737.1 hypothetical protein [Cyanobacteria bacterium CRU_2_1]